MYAGFKKRDRISIGCGLLGLILLQAAAGQDSITDGSSAVFQFDIPRQPLIEALRTFTATTGVQVIVPQGDVRQTTSQPVGGSLTADAAINTLVADTGFQTSPIVDGTLSLSLMQGAEPQRPLPSRVDEIVVFGTKQDLTLQETQTSVELYTEQMMEERAFVSLDDILLRTPNVSAINAQTSFSIRGIGQSGVGFAGTGLTANVYVDGAPLTVNAQNGAQSLWDVGQVEVLRGPQSTVQGRNALAGALVMQTSDPTYDWEFRLRGQAASQETGRGSAVVSGPIVDQQLAFRLVVDYQTYDAGVVEVLTDTPQEFQDSYTYRGKLLFEPDALPGFRAELKLERVETDFGEFNTRFAPVPFDDPAIDDFDPYGNETYTRVRLEDSLTDIANLELRQAIGDHWTGIGQVTFEDQTRDQLFCGTAAGSCSLVGGPTTTEQYSAELRAAFDYDRIDGWIGAYYFDSDIERVLDISLPAAATGFPATPPDAVINARTVQAERIENYALFADVTFELNERWSVNIGARYDREDFFDSGQQGSVSSDPPDCTLDSPFGVIPCGAILPVASDPATPAEFSAFLPRGGLIYAFNEDRTLSFSIQRGYRAGGAELVAIEGADELVPIAFEPEFVTNYELAFRSQFLDRKLTLNANLFYLDWEDQQVTIPGPSGNPLAQDAFVDNVGESTVYGMEMSLNAQVSDEFELFAGLGLLESEFTEFPFAPLDPSGEFTDLSGNAFPAAPNVSASFGANYRHPSGFFANFNASYQGERESDVTNLAINKVDSYILANARVGFEFERVNVYAFANNLFDERFATRLEFAGINPSTGGLDVRPNARYQINEPQIVGLSVEIAY